MESKRKFEVWLIGIGSGCFAKDYRRVLLGSTWAVSPKKAEANIKYRLRTNGETLPEDVYDRYGEGSIKYELKAVAV